MQGSSPGDLTMPTPTGPTWTRWLLEQPLNPVQALSSKDLPDEHGIYAWFLRDELLYVGEAPTRTLRERIWKNHLRGNAYGSTLRNKVAQALDCVPVTMRRFKPGCEKDISDTLARCQLRVLATRQDETAEAQAAVIRDLDPPMNDHPGERPRWRVIRVRSILGL